MRWLHFLVYHLPHFPGPVPSIRESLQLLRRERHRYRDWGALLQDA
jgi:hypothetical protein